MASDMVATRWAAEALREIEILKKENKKLRAAIRALANSPGARYAVAEALGKSKEDEDAD